MSRILAAVSTWVVAECLTDSHKQQQVQLLSQLFAVCHGHGTHIAARKLVVPLQTPEKRFNPMCSTHKPHDICCSLICSFSAFSWLFAGYVHFTCQESKAFSGVPASGPFLPSWSCPWLCCYIVSEQLPELWSSHPPDPSEFSILVRKWAEGTSSYACLKRSVCFLCTIWFS